MFRRPALAYFLLASVLVAAVYANSLENAFHFDDGHSIQDNAWLRSLTHLPRYFTDVSTFSPLAENRAYRPILLTSFAISHAIGGGAPWAYHLVTLLLHILGAGIIGLLTRRLLRAGSFEEGPSHWAALVATAIFSVHPLLSEPVNYISSRSSLMTAVLMFASVHLYVRARELDRPRLLVGTNLLLLLALGTKLNAITVPAILVAWELLLGPSRDNLRADGMKRWLTRLAAPTLIALLFAMLHEQMVGAYARGARSNVTPWSHLLTQTRVWMHYQALSIWPEDLCADLVMRWSEVPWEGETARAILWALFLGVAALLSRKRLPIFAFGIVWYFVTLSPTNSIVPLSEPATEHRVYVAFPGLLFAAAGLALVLLGERLRTSRARALLALSVCAILLALGARTVLRNRVWSTERTLWADTIECSPTNGRAHLNYGRALMAAGELGSARLSFERCAAEWPGFAFCYINLAVLDLFEKKIDDAEGHISSAVELQPNNVYTQEWRGEVFLAQSRFTDAEAAFRRATEIAPGYAGAERGLAASLFELGRLEEARALLNGLEQKGALEARGWFAQGYLAETSSQPARALTSYEQALALDATHDRARYNLASLLQRQGRRAEAIPLYEVLASRPKPNPDTLFNLALAHWEEGNLDQAKAVRGALVSQFPSYPRLSQLDF